MILILRINNLRYSGNSGLKFAASKHTTPNLMQRLKTPISQFIASQNDIADASFSPVFNGLDVNFNGFTENSSIFAFDFEI